ncbi:Imm49 family immunity protein [Corallococcus sp. bb12-1]|uniref:Imm49 family immunity protein n=1 Tax=Corallococcus sp. bb12-1 TaxID=2996784 RepID=UPI0022704ECF|nr:Imm49 family immunity protein [Corallococcus sp. bb12-1]MCY1042344.1 Imm49 family immunity protein [Corallococcus sp. bb12-1]
MDVPLWLIRKDLGISLQMGLPRVLGRNVTLRQILIFCGYYRRMGIVELFLTGRPEGFIKNLAKSARAFSFYLEGTPEEAKATSQAEPFFDAVACDDQQAAMTIARNSRATWNHQEEYEEDFLYARLLMDLFGVGAEKDHLHRLLSRYEQVLGNAEDSRLEMCRALIEKDQKLFDETLERMLGDHRRAAEKKLNAGQMSPNDAATVSHVWVELVALLRFAEQARMNLARNYPLAPSLIRRANPSWLPPEESWRDIPSYFELE